MDIRIEGLRKTFGSAAAVDNMDLSVKDGSMLVLLGPSGCGKTTTMRCIAGLEAPDRGRISIGPRVVYDSATRANVAVHQRNVGMVFQSYAIWPHMTVAENVAYPLDMANVGKAEKQERVNAILDLVGLAGFGDRGASYLSGGQMQRVALARSLVMRPSVLLFDEPLSNLDARLRDRLRVQLRELQTQFGITSVYVTHDQREALALADEIAVMQEGRIAQLGDPFTIYHAPRTSSIADFLGYSNIFDATPEHGQGAFSVRTQAALLQPERAPDDPGIPLAACVRPEDILMHEASGAEGLANSVHGVITLASFLGSAYQYRVRAEGGEMWEALVPATQRPFRMGERARLEIPARSVLVLPKS